jgi:hypothetical protein
MSPKTKKILIIGGITGVIALIAGFVIVRKKRATDIEKSLLLGSPNVGNSDNAVGALIEWPLKYGSGYLSDSERACVRTVQLWLNKKINENNVYSLPVLIVDGHFGSMTETALQKIAGVRQVSYTLYKTMDEYITSPIGSLFDKIFSIKPEEL